MFIACILIAELGILSVGINSSLLSSFVLAIYSQYYLRKWVLVQLFRHNEGIKMITGITLVGSESTSQCASATFPMYRQP